MISSIPPKVSVCMPVYNGSAYIAQSIESVLAQTYKDFNIIISDNCSTDNTEEIVRSFHDPRIIYLKNPENIGLVNNFNRTISLADGEYVCVWAHDDLMLPDNLERKVIVLDENPRVGIVHSDVLMIDQNGQILDKKCFEDAKRDYIEDGMKVFNQYIMKMPLGASIFIGAVLARRTCYTQLGGYHPQLPNTCDSEMWMRISLFYDVACIGTPLVKYRIHQNMTSTSITESAHMSLRGLEEHYLASRIILSRYSDRIPQWKTLRKQVLVAFARMALIISRWFYDKGDLSMCITFLKASLKFYPLILGQKMFWGVTLRLMSAPVQKIFNVPHLLDR